MAPLYEFQTFFSDERFFCIFATFMVLSYMYFCTTPLLIKPSPIPCPSSNLVPGVFSLKTVLIQDGTTEAILR